jgi:hypothetical protein
MYRCPKCGSTDLDVTALIDVRLYQDEDEETGEVEFETDYGEARNNDHEWDENSTMTCRQCVCSGTGRDFLRTDDTAEAFKQMLNRDQREIVEASLADTARDLCNHEGRDKEWEEWASIRLGEIKEIAEKLGLDLDA